MKGEPVLAGHTVRHRRLRELERQQRQLRSRERQTQMDERSALVQIGRQRAGQSRHAAEELPHLGAQVVQHRQAILGISGFIAKLLQQAIEASVLVGNVDDAGPGIAADGEIRRERREQLIVRWPGSQKLDVHQPNRGIFKHRSPYACMTGQVDGTEDFCGNFSLGSHVRHCQSVGTSPRAYFFRALRIAQVTSSGSEEWM